jgi:gamma-glutamylcyclotransferase (GGCT)/AIG2-like uncharacterized protein YtfP
MSKLLFVYGTLKKFSDKGYNFGRFGKQYLINEGVKFHGFSMHLICGHYPAICRGNGTINGEIHEINDDVFSQLLLNLFRSL